MVFTIVYILLKTAGSAMLVFNFKIRKNGVNRTGLETDVSCDQFHIITIYNEEKISYMCQQPTTVFSPLP